MEVISFYYRKDENLFENEDGEPTFNIFEYISPTLLGVFKNRSSDGVVWYHYPKAESKVVYEFIFPFEEEEGFDY